MERGNRPPPPPPLPLLFSGGGPRANAAAADRGAIGRRGSGIEMTEGKVAAADDDDGGLGEPGTPQGNKVIYRAGRPIGRKVLKVMFWDVPPSSLGNR